MDDDALTWIADSRTNGRALLVRLVDRLEALADLEQFVFELAGRRGAARITPEQMFATVEGEVERARLVALLDRATRPTEEVTTT